MKKFKLLINGKNFLLESEKGIQTMGFYITLFVEADNSTNAENKAFELLKNNDAFKKSKNDQFNPPIMYVEEIEEVQDLNDSNQKDTGFVFYIEQPRTKLGRNFLIVLTCLSIVIYLVSSAITYLPGTTGVLTFLLTSIIINVPSVLLLHGKPRIFAMAFTGFLLFCCYSVVQNAYDYRASHSEQQGKFGW